MEVTSRSFYRHDSRNHLLFHLPSNLKHSLLLILPLPLSLSLSFFPSALTRCFVAQLYGNCSLTNRLNPLFSFQGEDNHPPRTSQFFDLPFFVDPFRPTQPFFLAPIFDLPSGFPRLMDYFALVSTGFSTPAKWPRQPFAQTWYIFVKNVYCTW